VDPSTTAELKTLLSGVDLPAEKPALLAYAVRQRAEPTLVEALNELPDREFASLDEVVEALLHVQPAPPPQQRPMPEDESGAPPGGDAYTEPPTPSS
jgi:uncharacterized protein DUF2795